MKFLEEYCGEPYYFVFIDIYSPTIPNFDEKLLFTHCTISKCKSKSQTVDQSRTGKSNQDAQSFKCSYNYTNHDRLWLNIFILLAIFKFKNQNKIKISTLKIWFKEPSHVIFPQFEIKVK